MTLDLRVFTEPQQGATYDDLLAVARASEDLGFSGFFRSDHYLHMGGDGGPGRRKVADVTRVPRRMVEVSRASPARVVQASVGPGPPSPPMWR